MKIIRNISGTSPRLTIVINEPLGPNTPANVEVANIDNEWQNTTKIDLVYQITRSVLRCMQYHCYNENHDILAANAWLNDVFGQDWKQIDRDNNIPPDQVLLARERVKERVIKMASQLINVEMYERLLYGPSYSETEESFAYNPLTSEHYSGLLTIRYMPFTPVTDEERQAGRKPHRSLRIIKEIPGIVLEPLMQIYRSDRISTVTSDEGANARRPHTDRQAYSTSESANSTNGVRIQSALRQQLPKNIDYRDLSERDRHLVRTVVHRVATIVAEEVLDILFNDNRRYETPKNHRAPQQTRHAQQDSENDDNDHGPAMNHVQQTNMGNKTIR